jgi:PIN domain nuclease of toxin-antitoxin system
MRADGRPLLFDTHIWIWYVEGEAGRFSRRLEPLVEATVLKGGVLVSTISVWEIAMLEARRRIDLSVDARTWTARALGFPGVKLKGLSSSIAIESTRLPGSLHGDPVDRILVATARLLGASLVTRDERILQYARDGHVRVVDATP